MNYTLPVRLKARKPHKCSSCGETIEKGQEYLRWAWFDEGSASTVKMHPECFDMHAGESYNGTFEFTLYQYERPPA